MKDEWLEEMMSNSLKTVRGILPQILSWATVDLISNGNELLLALTAEIRILLQALKTWQSFIVLCGKIKSFANLHLPIFIEMNPINRHSIDQVIRLY